MVIDLERLHITRHAWQAMKDRNVTPEQVVAVLRDPAVTEPHMGRRRFVKGDLAVVVDDDGVLLRVVTVLWRRGQQWTSESMAARA